MLLLRHRLVAVAVLGACFLMAITAGISLATTLATVILTHASAFPGTNNNPGGATKDTGYLFATSGSAGQVQADGNYLEFTQAALDWIRANEAGFYGPQEFKIAFVHHAFVADSNGVYAYADPATVWSNLPSPLFITFSTSNLSRLGPQNEVRTFSVDQYQPLP